MTALQVYKDRVLEAANACPQAKTVLMGLFPEAFEPQLPLYKQLDFKPGTKWRHSTSNYIHTYLGDTESLGRALGFPNFQDSFFSLAEGGCFAYTSKRATNLIIV